MIEPPPPYDEVALGVAISRLRMEEGLTLEQLAERSGVSRRQLINIEQAKHAPTVTTLHAIAYGLNVAVGDLANVGSARSASGPSAVAPVSPGGTKPFDERQAAS
ncbi:helix-turn-helix transcriptional regulator [Paractinoplanes brasiliensis]|nr:helix-turn-helix transcriptional regulator [Actinoplanes brasiliensis]